MSENGPTGNPAPPDGETPVDRVIRILGWPRACEIAGRTPAALMKWKRPISKNGGGGLVPSRLQAEYLKAAEEAGLDLKAEDLIAEPVQ